MEQLNVTLHPDGVAAPVQRAAFTAFEVVSACLSAFAQSELAPPIMPGQFVTYGFSGIHLTSDERRAMYESWLLAKGFQDLARGVRETLEEAILYLNLVNLGRRPGTLDKFNQTVVKIRKYASSLVFPKLIG